MDRPYNFTKRNVIPFCFVDLDSEKGTWVTSAIICRFLHVYYLLNPCTEQSPHRFVTFKQLPPAATVLWGARLELRSENLEKDHLSLYSMSNDLAIFNITTTHISMFSFQNHNEQNKLNKLNIFSFNLYTHSKYLGRNKGNRDN